MLDEIFESYLKAGKAVAKALELGKVITRPDANYLDIATLCEGEILKNGCDLAFPINISLNEIAAHYSPIIDDKTKVPEQGLIKIDCGAHFNGYIADAAVTINIGENKGIYQDLVNAANEGLKVAIKNFNVGTNLVEIGTLIERAITSYNVKPVSNLGGHALDQHNLHAGAFVPNIPQAGSNYKIKLDDAFAIEPFSTNGAGRITEHRDTTIFRVGNVKTKKLKLKDRALAQKFKQKFKTLPFSPRAIDFIEKQRIKNTIDRFRRYHIIEGYPIFIEIAKGFVAQAEHTVIVTDEGAHITTVLDNGL
jgi:methionyl aminopeptidase